MRILTVGNMYPPHHLGGYEVVWEEAVRHLRDRGHSVRVLTTDFHREDKPLPTDSELDVHRELRWYWRDHEWPRFSAGDRLRLERENAAVFERHLADFRPDVVGWWAMGGMSLSLIERTRRQGIPAAGFVCDEWMVYGPRTDAWIRATNRSLIGRTAALLTRIPTKLNLDEAGPWLFPSETLRDKSATAWGLSDTVVMHQGVDRELFTPADPTPWSWRLLYAGRIDPRKGIDLAVRAISRLPEAARLDVVGNGDRHYLQELKAVADKEGVGDRVVFHGDQPRQELPERYAEADAVLFPVRWEEPWGLVPLEAMAVGTPVIASGRGGSGEFLKEGMNSLIFDPDEGPDALAARISTLAQDDALRARLREGGLETTASISADGFTRAVEEMLIRAARRPQRSRA